MSEFKLSTPTGELVLKVAGAGARAARGEGANAARFFLVAALDSGDPKAEAIALALTKALNGSSPPPGLSDAQRKQLARDLEQDFRQGRIAAEVRKREVARPKKAAPSPAPKAPPPKKDEKETFYDVRFVDETGMAVGQFPMEFSLGGETREVKANGGGVGLLENVIPMSAAVSVVAPEAIEKVLDQRWTKFRPGAPPKAGNSTDVVFNGQPLGPIDVKPAVPNRVVLKPPLGRIFVELFDKTGRVRHAQCPYVIDGPQRFEGKTDDEGRIAHEDVFPGDYTLEFDQTIEIGEEKRVEKLKSQLVVLQPNAATPEVRMLGVVPRVVLARLKGLLFDTDKSFLLPASAAVFERIKDVYRQERSAKLLIVGHTDTTGDASINDPLSLERADNTLAYLRDDVDTWLAMYDASVRAKGRWGAQEDMAMILSLPDFDQKPESEDAVRWFQRTRGLDVDGVAGPKTRRQLITEYMAKDGASLDEEEFDIEATTHGCGENFPLNDGQDGVDESPLDDKEDAADRRVELFFFDPEFGIVPPPPGKNSKKGSTEYPEWRKRAEVLSDDTVGQFNVAVRLFDNAGEPLPKTAFELDAGPAKLRGKSDAEGFVRTTLDVKAEKATLRWLPVDAESEEFEVEDEAEFVYTQEIFLELLGNAKTEEDRKESTRRALHNLGYDGDDLEANVRHFQYDNELEETGVADDVRSEVLRRNDEGEPNKPAA